MQQVNNYGLFLIGACKGILENRRTGNDGQPWVQHFLGIEVPKNGGFPGETDVLRVQVPKDLVAQGITGQVEKMIGKTVKADVWVRSYATRSGANHQLSLSSYLDAVSLFNAPELKKAV